MESKSYGRKHHINGFADPEERSRTRKVDRDRPRPIKGHDNSEGSASVMTMLRHTTSKWISGRAPRIGIVGAGVSGLRCAEVLTEKGVDVTIFEGRDRVGGRLYQANSGSHLVDMGANWIHGTDHNPILELAKITYTQAISIGEDSETFGANEKQWSIQRSSQISDIVWGIISDAFKYSNESGNSISPKQSLKDFFRAEVQQKHLSQDDETAVLYLAELWGAFVGSSYERQSLKYFWLEECIDGENLFVASTYAAILQHIAAPVLQRANICLSTTVTSITTPDKSSDPVQITTSAETAPSAFDAIVLTASLGCLKADQPPISPPLPPNVRSAIRSIGYGNLEKVYLTFPAAFWDPPEFRYPLFTHFLHPSYAGQQNSSASMISLVSLSGLPESLAHPTLLFYIFGPFAAEVVESIKHLDASSPKYLNSLTDRFKPYYSKLPGYKQDKPDCQPIATIATKWGADDLARGSYSNFLVPANKDSESANAGPELDICIETLRHGCPERGLWLAGEHTAPFVALGTVTGAYWSGEKVAERVIDWFEGKRSEDSAPKTEDKKPGLETVQVGKGNESGIGGIQI